VQQLGLKFECPISHDVPEANQRELCAVFNAILRDGYDIMVSDAAADGKKADELADILKRLDLNQHAKKLQEEGIDLAAARKLTDDHFQELGLNYSERSSLISALAASNSGPSVVIENGKLSAWLPFVCISHLEKQFPVIDSFNSAVKLELNVTPSSQGGLEAILSGRASRSGLTELADKVGDPDSRAVMIAAQLSTLSLKLDLFDLLELVKKLEASRMVDEKDRVQELPQIVPKVQAAILDMFNFTRNTWKNGEPRWFALLKLIHRDIYGRHARVSGELTIAKSVCIKFSAEDIDCALQLYPAAAREITAPPGSTQQQQQQQQKSKQQVPPKKR